jgi:hypothetical protein
VKLQLHKQKQKDQLEELQGQIQLNNNKSDPDELITKEIF